MASEKKVRGKARNIKGRAKEAWGSITGDKSKQAEGTLERAGGAVEEKIGEAEEEMEERKK